MKRRDAIDAAARSLAADPTFAGMTPEQQEIEAGFALRSVGLGASVQTRALRAEAVKLAGGTPVELRETQKASGKRGGQKSVKKEWEPDLCRRPVHLPCEERIRPDGLCVICGAHRELRPEAFKGAPKMRIRPADWKRLGAAQTATAKRRHLQRLAVVYRWWEGDTNTNLLHKVRRAVCGRPSLVREAAGLRPEQGRIYVHGNGPYALSYADVSNLQVLVEERIRVLQELHAEIEAILDEGRDAYRAWLKNRTTL